MAGSGRLSPRGNTREVARNQWIQFLDDFTRRNRGAHARLQEFGGEAGRVIETENRPLDGVSADLKDGEQTVWIIFGVTPQEHLAHAIPNATVIRMLPGAGKSGDVLEVETRDGTKTLLELSPPAEYALPEG